MAKHDTAGVYTPGEFIEKGQPRWRTPGRVRVFGATVVKLVDRSLASAAAR